MENKQTQSGVGFFGLLTLVFIALKLMGYIDWQWVSAYDNRKEFIYE